MEASGEGLSYQWYGLDGEALTDNTGEIEGSITDTLRIVDAQSGDAGNYGVSVSNVAGLVDSEEVTLTIGMLYVFIWCDDILPFD